MASGGEAAVGSVMRPLVAAAGDQDAERDARERTAEALAASERKYRELVEHANSIILHWTSDGLVTFLNEYGQRFFGYPEAEILGRHVVGTIVPETESTGRDLRTLLDRIGADPKAFEHNINENVRRDGQKVWIEWTNKVDFDDQGRVVGVLSIGSDITERRHAELALRESEERFRNLMEHVPGVAIQGYRPDGTVEYWNRASERVYGWPAAEAVGRHLADLIVPPPLKDAFAACLAVGAQVTQSGEFLPSGELRLQRQDGSPVDVWSMHTAICIEGREPLLFCLDVDLAERKEAEEALRESERNYREIYNATNDAIFIHDAGTGAILDVNDAMLQLFGFSREEALRLGPNDSSLGVSPYSAVEAAQWMAKAAAEGPQVFEWQARRKNGEVFWVEVALKCADLSGRRCVLAVVRDIGERKRNEEEKAELAAQLQQAQRIESVGRLAGGVAHDFNNMLGVILGHTELALGRMSARHEARADLEAIQGAAQRSADLTRQLLAFARRQPITPRVLDLNQVVAGTLEMLRRLIGEDIQLGWRPQPDLWPVLVDPSQVDQIIANLCVNARDAIADIGRVTIETGNRTFTPADCEALPEVAPGPYVRLAVSDTGCGIDRDTLAHIFEPFFTTKAVGRGTGLGLATVYGAARQNGGFVDVDSEPGVGSTFAVYLPRCQGPREPGPTGAAARQAGRRDAVILVVEDEPSILDMTATMLGRHGYTVLTAGTPNEALRLARDHPGQLDLLITDVIMPEMNGRELAQRMTNLHPRLQCVYMSGYTADTIGRHGVLDEGVRYVQKPFTSSALLTTIAAALAEEPAA